MKFGGERRDMSERDIMEWGVGKWVVYEPFDQMDGEDRENLRNLRMRTQCKFSPKRIPSTC